LLSRSHRLALKGKSMRPGKASGSDAASDAPNEANATAAEPQ
jgi:hypothetical protein